MKDRAGRSIQHAVRFWNRYNWRWLQKVAPDYSVSASATGIALPYDFKDVYTLRWETGAPRAILGLPRRQFDRYSYDQTVPGPVSHYELMERGDQGVLGFVPAANESGTVRLRYYRRMWVPCTVTGVSVTGANGSNVLNGSGLAGVTIGSFAAGYGTVFDPVTATITVTGTPFSSQAAMSQNWTATGTTAAGLSFGGDATYLDIPEDYENGILARAAAHFLGGLGAPEGRLSYFQGMAEQELDRAIVTNHEYEDQDICFLPDTTPPFTLINPNATIQ
jgi:hypothetical protein